MDGIKRASLPEGLRRDVSRAAEILKEEGCSDVFIFGSTATGNLRADSDIDLAVRGCPRGQFFRVFGRLLWELERPVDLIDLDSRDPFSQYLQQEAVLVRVE
jgi:predicted nucleotidyltransferase